jgi:DNA-binding NtrC family response regulator
LEDRTVKIWVVDDDPAICNMLRIMLSTKGHEVETYPDPTATPVACEPGPAAVPSGSCADAMLVDYFMPKMNGLDFLKLMDERGCGTVKGNKAIITAYGTSELCHELDQLGVKYFKKPFRFPDIVKWLEDCARRLDAQDGVTCA